MRKRFAVGALLVVGETLTWAAMGVALGMAWLWWSGLL